MSNKMNKNEVITILEDWNFWKRNIETGIFRNAYLEKLQRLMTSNHIVAVIGPRRSGKSFIMRQFAQQLMEQGVDKKNILFINFEDPRFPKLDAKALGEIYEIYLEFLMPKGEVFVFLDEIQE